MIGAALDKAASGAAQGAATGAAAVAAVTAAAVAVGTALETGSLTAAIEMGAIAAGGAAGSELGPIGAAVGAVIGALVALGGDATTGPMAFVSSDPVEFMKELVAPGNPILIEALKDAPTAVALTVWVETGYADTFDAWLHDFFTNPQNGARVRIRTWMATHPKAVQFFLLLPDEMITSDPLQQFAATIARIDYAVRIPRTGAHQAAGFISGFGETDEDWGGIILHAAPAQTHLNPWTYAFVDKILKDDAKAPGPTFTRIPQIVLAPKKGSVMLEVVDYAKEKAQEAVEVVYKDGAVTKVGKGLGIAAGIVIVLKVLAGRK